MIYKKVVIVEDVGTDGVCAAMPAPCNGEIRSWKVRQVSGVLNGYVVRIFDQAAACGLLDSASADPDEIPAQAVSELASALTPMVAVVAGESDYADYDCALAYRNQNTATVGGPPDFAVYFFLQTESGSGASFEVSYTIELKD